MSSIYALYLSVSRIILPILSVSLLFLWCFFFAKHRKKTNPIARLIPEFGDDYNYIISGENMVGYSKSCDIVLDNSDCKRHAIIGYDGDSFYVTPLDGYVFVNEEEIFDKTYIKIGDFITFGEEIFLLDLPAEQEVNEYPTTNMSPVMLLLTLFQFVLCVQVCLNPKVEQGIVYPLSMSVFVIFEWLYVIFQKSKHSDCLLFAEIPVAYLVTVGLAVCYCCTPDGYIKQLICVAIGLVGALILRGVLSGLPIITVMRYLVACGALALLAVNLVFGTRVNGSRNWLDLGPLSFQPSELVKVAYIFSCACILCERELSKFSTALFLGFSAVCMGCLAAMVDFGAVAIFFFTMIIILLMRHGSVWFSLFLTLGAFLAAIGLVLVFPHIAQRFSAWTKVWDYPNSLAYQQARTLIACASGGLFGVGAGNGYLKKIAAADTDLVFGVVSEEFGGIVAFCVAACFVILAVYAVSLSKKCISTYYAIAVCAAAGMMLFQTALNIFGSLDILPLTGVTIPFVSNGGTSMISGMCMIAFFKAAEKTPEVSDEIERRYF